MSRLERDQRLATRSAARDADEFPGTIEFYDEATKTYGLPLTAAVTFGSIDREHEDGGFVRVRSASVILTHVSRTSGELPDPATRPRVRLTRGAYPNKSEEFRIFEHHDEAPGIWLLRCAQWNR